MRRALRGGVGVVLAIGTVLAGRSASAQSPSQQLWYQPNQIRKVQYKDTVVQVLRDGQRVVQVTRDSSNLMLPSVASSPTVAPAPLPKTPRPAYLPATNSSSWTATQPTLLPSPRPMLPPPPPLTGRSLDAQDGELRLPLILSSKPTNAQPQPKPARIGSSLDSLTPPQLPTKWRGPATRWEASEKKRQAPTPTLTGQQKNMPAIFAAPNPSVDTKKPIPFAEPMKPSRASNAALPSFTESHGTTTPAILWNLPSGRKESQPKTPVATTKPEKASSSPATAPPSVATLQRWPSAYGAHTPESNGRPGTITFDDDPPPAPKPTFAPRRASYPIVPANLQRQIYSVCGRQARDILVAVQRDGTVLVKVKVPNTAVENQLTRKILAIPEMTSPQVRLLMDVGP